MADERFRITISANGPYLVAGPVPLSTETIVVNEAGESVGWERGDPLPVRDGYALCRCGASKIKPYCDGSHVASGFDGAETASRSPFAQRAVRIEGPGLDLLDVPDLCALTRHCRAGGKLWHIVERSDDPVVRRQVIDQSWLCPAGRYVAVDKETGEAIELAEEPAIGLMEDPKQRVSSGIWVHGRIPVESSDGSTYEIRDRVALCRCGASKNKPFCDGSHETEGFCDGL